MEPEVEKRNLAQKGYHFFKIIDWRIIGERRLQLPGKFAELYGDKVADDAVLRVRSGNTWSVELTREQDKLWLERGWPDFLERHSISAGQFLMFRYEGNSQFLVGIFDMSGCERFNPALADEQDPIVDNMEAEDLGGIGPKQENGANMVVDEGEEHAESSKSCVENMQDDCGSPQILDPIMAHFTVNMKPTYVNHGYSLLPLGFVKDHMEMLTKYKSVVLEVQGRRWDVGVLIKPGNSGKLSNGWGCFAKENNLKTGNVCLFELMEENIFKVSIH